MQPINLFGVGLHADSSVLASENRLNCFYDIRKSDTGSTIAVRGTPGFYALLNDPQYVIAGLRVVNNMLYFVSRDGLYSMDTDNNVSFLAPGPSGHPYVQMSDNYIQVIILTGSSGWVFTIATGVMAQITDANFPSNARSVTFISGRFVVEKRDTREYYTSAALDGLTWTYLSLPMFGTKEQASDPLFMVSSQNGILTLWGQDTMEFWQDAGLTPVPFQLIQGTQQSYGTKSLYSVCHVNDSTMFLGHGPQGGWAVFSLKGYTITKVSTPDIDDILADWVTSGATFKYTHGVAYNSHGHDFYQLTDVGNGSLLYDATTGLWSKTLTGNTSNSSLGTISVVHEAQQAALFNGQTVFASTRIPLCILDVNTFNDGGLPIQRQVTSKHIRNGGNEFAITELVLLMDTGEVPLAQDYHITLEISRDGGRTFGSPRPRTIGLTGQYKEPRVKWDRLGSARDFVLRFTMTDPIPFVIASAEIETSVNQ